MSEAQILQELHLVLNLLLASVLAAAIGYNREAADKPAGLRTHMLVGLGSAMFVIIGELLLVTINEVPVGEMNYDPVRILEAVVAGVAFLGAGTIFFARGDNVVRGLTTAASMWATAGVGMAVALEHYVLAIGTTALITLILQLFIVTQGRHPDKPGNGAD